MIHGKALAGEDFAFTGPRMNSGNETGTNDRCEACGLSRLRSDRNRTGRRVVCCLHDNRCARGACPVFGAPGSGLFDGLKHSLEVALEVHSPLVEVARSENGMALPHFGSCERIIIQTCVAGIT
eukprot:scaffold90748_cov25-Prasinocladus_malaysianus.AAC.1